MCCLFVLSSNQPDHMVAKQCRPRHRRGSGRGEPGAIDNGVAACPYQCRTSPCSAAIRVRETSKNVRLSIDHDLFQIFTTSILFSEGVNVMGQQGLNSQWCRYHVSCNLVLMVIVLPLKFFSVRCMNNTSFYRCFMPMEARNLLQYKAFPTCSAVDLHKLKRPSK